MQKGYRIIFLSALLLASLFLGACRSQVEAPTPAVSTPAASSAQGAGQAGTVQVAPLDPLDPGQTQPPVRLEIPAIGLTQPVTEMGWQIVMVDGERTTAWVVPESGLGWHANSAGAGAAGNTVISGRQVGNGAPLAALAIGEIQIGQEVLLTDSDGLVFVYRIVEVSDPIPAAGASETDQAQAAAFFAPGDTPKLTLATGWPDFTTTHRIFAVGELEGVAR